MIIDDEGVYITSIGITCSLGRGISQVTKAILNGESGLSPMDIHGYQTSVGFVKSNLVFDPRYSQSRDRGTHLALDSVEQIKGLEYFDKEKIGIFWGVGLAGAHWIESTYKEYFDQFGDSKPSPWTVPAIMPNSTAATIAMKFGLKGCCTTIANACASSGLSLGQGAAAIARGELDAAIVGGSDAMLVPGMLHAWARMRVLSKTQETSSIASRPFHANRNGICLAEGAACMLLESGKAVRKNGKNPIACIKGFGQSCDATDMTEPSVDGQVRCMINALDSASIKVHQVGYLKAHATGTKKGDRTELDAIRQVFGNHINNLPISSLKGHVGHTVGASGAIEAAVVAYAMSLGVIPKNFALDLIDEDMVDYKLDFDGDRLGRAVNYAICNSFGFGGVNASVVIGAVSN